MDKKIIIAIDGYSSCGKSTMAKDLARTIGYTYIDTGAMYRAVTLYAMRHNLIEDDKVDADALAAQMDNIHITFGRDEATGLPFTRLNGENIEREIRSLAVSAHVSPVSALPFVRSALTRQQQEMGRAGGVVMDGRDIGTAVLPNAPLKVYLTASAHVRALRRWKELTEKGQTADLAKIEEDINERDYQDMHREHSPLVQAEDAVLVDSSEMTIDEVVEKILSLARERM